MHHPILTNPKNLWQIMPSLAFLHLPERYILLKIWHLVKDSPCLTCPDVFWKKYISLQWYKNMVRIRMRHFQKNVASWCKLVENIRKINHKNPRNEFYSNPVSKQKNNFFETNDFFSLHYFQLYNGVGLVRLQRSIKPQ